MRKHKPVTWYMLLALTSVALLLVCCALTVVTIVNPFFGMLWLRVGIPLVIAWFVLFAASLIMLKRRHRPQAGKWSGVSLAALLFAPATIYAGGEIADRQHLSDRHIIVYDRTFSPDKSSVIIGYVYDIGALGYTRMFHAVMPVTDTTRNLRKYALPYGYRPVEWRSSDSLIVRVNERLLVDPQETPRKRIDKVGSVIIIVDE